MKKKCLFDQSIQKYDSFNFAKKFNAPDLTRTVAIGVMFPSATMRVVTAECCAVSILVGYVMRRTQSDEYVVTRADRTLASRNAVMNDDFI